MNTNTAHANTAQVPTFSSSDLSHQAFVERCTTLGFSRALVEGKDRFVHHNERVIVAPVIRYNGQMDRYATLELLEASLYTYARRQCVAIVVSLLLAVAAVLCAVFWPTTAAAIEKQSVIETAATAEADAASSTPLYTCTLNYTVGPHDALVLQCTHRLRGVFAVERMRSGDGRVLISAANTVNRGDAVLITLYNTSATPITSVATVEFW